MSFTNQNFDPDSKRGAHGFPVLTAQNEDETEGAGSSAEPPPPTYEEATTSNAALSEPASPSLSVSTSEGPRFPSPQLDGSTISRNSSYAAPSPLGRDKSLSVKQAWYAPSPSGSGVSRALSASSSVSRNTSIASSGSGSKGKTIEKPPLSPTLSSESPSDHPPGETVLTPPQAAPASFDRAPPLDLPYGAFPPAVLYARSADLERDGFELAPPSCNCAPAPHPFATHDVNEEDWERFLRDVQGAGGLKAVNSVVAQAAPTVAMAGLLGGMSRKFSSSGVSKADAGRMKVGFIATTALRYHVNGKRKSPVADIIDEWNRVSASLPCSVASLFIPAHRNSSIHAVWTWSLPRVDSHTQVLPTCLLPTYTELPTALPPRACQTAIPPRASMSKSTTTRATMRSAWDEAEQQGTPRTRLDKGMNLAGAGCVGGRRKVAWSSRATSKRARARSGESS